MSGLCHNVLAGKESTTAAQKVTALRSLPDPAVQEANLLLMDLMANVGSSCSLN